MDKTTDKKLIELAHKRFAEGQSRDSQNMIAVQQDVDFVRLGNQWPEALKRVREQPGAERPTLVINRLEQYRNQVVNEIRQSKPSIKFRPADDQANDDSGKMLESVVRSIQYDSNADLAYDNAVNWQIDGGIGYFRINTEYQDDDSFDQKICIESVIDPTSIVTSEYKEINGSDMEWCFLPETYTKEEFEQKYPDADMTSWDFGNTSWTTEETIIVAEYFYLEKKKVPIVLLSDQTVMTASEAKQANRVDIEKKRTIEDKRCKWVKIAGDKILESGEMPCSYIPIIPVIGVCIWLKGKRYLQGLVRNAKDSQRLYNYMQSANAELNALSTRNPFIAAEGQISGHEAEWANANNVNTSVLIYNPIDAMGNVLPPPRRPENVQTNSGLETSMNRSVDDIKSTLGMYSASVGDKEGDQSGKAIQTQLRQASTINFHFQDNLVHSLRHAGCIILELIPSVYSNRMQMTGIQENGDVKKYQMNPDQDQAHSKQDGQADSYNLSAGKHSVIVDVGPSYATKRMEALESQMELIKIDPAVMQIAGDIIVKNMEWDGSEQIAERMKAMLPPQIQQLEKKDQQPQQQIPPEIEQKMQHMADMVQHLSQELQNAQPQIEKVDIERFKAQTERMKVEHEIALDSTGLFHKIAMDSVAQTLQQPNTGEYEDEKENANEETANAQQGQEVLNKPAPVEMTQRTENDNENINNSTPNIQPSVDGG